MGVKNFLHSVGNAVTGNVDETATRVRLARSGNWVGPLEFPVIALAYGMTKDPNGGADLLSKASKGEEVDISMPTKILLNREQYTLCCLIANADAIIFAGIKRDTGNNRDTVYSMGRKDKKYYANTWFKIPSEHARFNQAYRRIMEVIYHIRPDADDFYDQVVLAQEKHTGQKFLRDPSLGDDGDWHGRVQADPFAEAKLNARIDFSKIDHNGGQSYENYALWYFLENGVYNVENCFTLNPEKLKEYIDALYRQGGVIKDDVDRATMSFAQLFASIALDMTTFCFARVSDRSASELSSKESVCALLAALKMFDKSAIDASLKELFTKNKPKEEPVSEIQRRYGVNEPQKPQDSNGQQRKRTANKDGYGGKPKMEDGRQVDFETIEGAIGDIEFDANDQKATEKQQLQLTRAAIALKGAMEKAKADGKDTIGASYLNWEIKNANPGVKKLELLDGSPVYFKTKVDEE